jgi:hypothetical protein
MTLVLSFLIYLSWPVPAPEATPGFSLEGLASIPAYSIRQPRSVPAAQAALADKEEVIGVSMGGKHRAYRLEALGGSMPMHVINDRLGEIPLSVTHCDRTDCTRVFNGEAGDDLLDLHASGWYRRQMMIRAGPGVYFHGTSEPVHPSFPSFPYAELTFERTTWKAWREAHPDTDVCVRVGNPVRYPTK